MQLLLTVRPFQMLRYLNAPVGDYLIVHRRWYVITRPESHRTFTLTVQIVERPSHFRFLLIKAPANFAIVIIIII